MNSNKPELKFEIEYWKRNLYLRHKRRCPVSLGRQPQPESDFQKPLSKDVASQAKRVKIDSKIDFLKKNYDKIVKRMEKKRKNMVKMRAKAQKSLLKFAQTKIHPRSYSFRGDQLKPARGSLKKAKRSFRVQRGLPRASSRDRRADLRIDDPLNLKNSSKKTYKFQRQRVFARTARKTAAKSSWEKSQRSSAKIKNSSIFSVKKKISLLMKNKFYYSTSNSLFSTVSEEKMGAGGPQNNLFALANQFEKPKAVKFYYSGGKGYLLDELQSVFDGTDSCSENPGVFDLKSIAGHSDGAIKDLLVNYDTLTMPERTKYDYFKQKKKSCPRNSISGPFPGDLQSEEKGSLMIELTLNQSMASPDFSLGQGEPHQTTSRSSSSKK